MLSQVQLQRLNNQIKSEADLSRLYLSISHWATSKGLNGIAKFFKAHHEEEEEHMHRLEDYVLSVGGKVIIAPLETPRTEFSDILTVLHLALEQEVKGAEAINDLVHSFFVDKDYATFNFLQWYVQEQHQEQFLFRSLIDKAELTGTKENGIFWLDKEMGQLVSQR